MAKDPKLSCLLIGIVTAWGILPQPTNARTPQRSLLNRRVADVAKHLVGVMDTSAQAAVNPKAPSVRMTTCPVQIEHRRTSPNAVFLYQEQALTSKLDSPYRQRFLVILPSQDGQSIESKSFKPVQPKTFLGLCAKPERQRVVSLDDLGVAVCSVFLRPTAQGYIGETPVGGCSAQVRGAVKVTNRVVLHAAGMDTWDRGYDERGLQVWGAADDSYQYRWLTLSPL